MPRFVTPVIVAALLLGVVLFAWNNQRLRSELAYCQGQLEGVAEQSPSAGAREEESPAGQMPVTYMYDNLTTAEADSLRALGLEDPVATVDSSLRAHPELIPYEGTLGGTMDFYGDDAVRVLGPARIAAVFSDGHNQGHMIVGYRVQRGGQIEFEVLEARM